MSDKVISINIKTSGDVEINICQSENTENISSNENNNIDDINRILHTDFHKVDDDYYFSHTVLYENVM